MQSKEVVQKGPYEVPYNERKTTFLVLQASWFVVSSLVYQALLFHISAVMKLDPFKCKRSWQIGKGAKAKHV